MTCPDPVAIFFLGFCAGVALSILVITYAALELIGAFETPTDTEKTP